MKRTLISISILLLLAGVGILIGFFFSMGLFELNSYPINTFKVVFPILLSVLLSMLSFFIILLIRE
jgi:hypothetical protein